MGDVTSDTGIQLGAIPNVATSAVNVLSLCAGGGGLDLGFRLVVRGARTVCFVENEVTAAGILAARMEDGGLDDAPLWTDLRTFDGRPWRGLVDCVIGGYPCQPFSIAGKQRGADDPRHLWPEVRRIVSEVQPALCFFENVSNHLRLGFHEVARDLQSLGYEVAAALVTASEIGAPHKRERLFIMAYVRGARRQQDARGPSRDETTHGGAGRVTFESDGDHELAGDGQAVADSAGARLAWAEDSGADRGNAPADEGRGLESERGRPGVGDPQFPRLEGRTGGGTNGEGRARLEPPAGRGAVGEFPPGPAEDWRGVPERLWPAAPQPSVRRVAYGMARRMDNDLPRADQLRILGNGVVPQQAAHAFRLLIREFEEIPRDQ